MTWHEIETAQKENRHEIILSGKEVSNRISESGLDNQLFTLSNLNYLSIHETTLDKLPDNIDKLINLQTLVLHSNKLEEVTDRIAQLNKLKVLDLSSNRLKRIPDEISGLTQLVSFNASNNQLESFPKFSNNSKLSVIEVSNNKLKEFPDVCYPDMSNLSEVRCSGNEIANIPDTIGSLSALKVLLLNVNKVQTIPGELADCTKLKELNLKDNPVSDRRLLKLIAQGHAKQVVDYIKQNCVRTLINAKATTKKGKKVPNKVVEVSECIPECVYKVNVLHFTNDSLKIVVQEKVKSVRPHLIACLVLNLAFTDETFKKFIQLQTKLHDTVCEKRNAATIATHDAMKLGNGDVVYTALPPNELLVKPLNRQQDMSGAQLFKKLQAEADALRKEKKRNVYSGIYKYLYLLEGKPQYPCLLNSNNEVISFPPITNSEISKMTVDTTTLLIEVTGTASQGVCKKVADTLLKEMTYLFGNLTIQQVKNVDVEGNLKNVYPSRTDLAFEDSNILIEREFLLATIKCSIEIPDLTNAIGADIYKIMWYKETPATESGVKKGGERREHATMCQREIQPGPVRIQHKGFGFLITDRPVDHTIYSYANELKKHNVTAVVRVCEPSYKVAYLESIGIDVYDLCYTDGGAPPVDIIDEWFKLLKDHFTKDPDGCIAVHCVAGLGRAPVMVAMSLIELGMSYEDTVELIRKKKRGAFNTKQLRFLEKYRPKSRLKINNNQSGFCCVQ
ncbi:hypothetical protein FQR65_LT11969 [Abscondita terminalis]|nr:hypothetical protein FQR65_LT11969 [Abscondita terminalis]